MRVILRLLSVALLAFALAACGDLVDDEAPPVDDPPEEEPADEPEEPDEAEADGAVVAVGSTDLGEVLVDDAGMTLYMFDPDEQGPSTCYDECEQNWPPLLTDGDPVAGDGVQEGLLGTTERDDGSIQVTYDGWPLYLWAGDAEPGDATGQGVQDVWWVMDADGTPLRDGGDEDGNDGPY